MDHQRRLGNRVVRDGCEADSVLCAVKVIAVWTVEGRPAPAKDRDVDRIRPVAGLEQCLSLPELGFGER